jgi:hypothetical protein
MDNMNTGILARLPLPWPPKKQQEDIVNYIVESEAISNRAIENAQHKIDILREYRTRLIADVVTGKLDVRGAEAPTIDEVEITEDLESLNEPDSDEIDDIEEGSDE